MREPKGVDISLNVPRTREVLRPLRTATFSPWEFFSPVNHPADSGASNGKRLHGGLRFASLRRGARLCAITAERTTES